MPVQTQVSIVAHLVEVVEADMLGKPLEPQRVAVVELGGLEQQIGRRRPRRQSRDMCRHRHKSTLREEVDGVALLVNRPMECLWCWRRLLRLTLVDMTRQVQRSKIHIVE